MENVKNNTNFENIPQEKFEFAQKADFNKDSKLVTKPLTYFQDAFRRFCKNKGAVVGGIVVIILLIFAIIGPWFTPYTQSYHDDRMAMIQPKIKAFYKYDFWDGCKKKEVGYINYITDHALGLETGKAVIKNDKVEISEDGTLYTYRYDTYYGTGFGKYKLISMEEYERIQRYQNETGRQVLYPTVHLDDRPVLTQDKENANIYYKTKKSNGKTVPALENGEVVPVYWTYNESEGLPALAAPYTSTVRHKGEDTLTKDGEKANYVYGRLTDGGVEVRYEYYEYYIYYHSYVLKDGIEEPLFIFGTTSEKWGGKDIYSSLCYGARFSFIFAFAVAVVNLIVGAIWGSIAGYFGGKTDLFMERFTDILGAVPTMIVITLLKMHMGTSGHALLLFITFFMTGWIGMAHTTRMQFYRFKNQEYVLAARTLGARDRRIMFKHIFPNAIGTLVTSCALVIPSMIYSETNLTYLGIVNLQNSVGTLLAAGKDDMMLGAYVPLFPCIFLVLLMLSFNLFGNGLRDAFNPSLRGAED